MRLLVFQHVECEHPGSLRRFLARDGVAWDAVELDRGEAIPDLSRYDALWVMGGPMDVWDVDEHPWLIAEKAAIRAWVRDLRKPFLGVCLGHQLLADALGGTCGPQRPAEVGVTEVEVKADTRIIAAFYTAPRPLNETALKAFAAANLARYKQPRAYIHLPELPTGANGKLLRRALRAQFKATP